MGRQAFPPDKISGHKSVQNLKPKQYIAPSTLPTANLSGRKHIVPHDVHRRRLECNLLCDVDDVVNLQLLLIGSTYSNQCTLKTSMTPQTRTCPCSTGTVATPGMHAESAELSPVSGSCLCFVCHTSASILQYFYLLLAFFR